MKTRNTIITKSYHFSCGEMIFGDFEGHLCLCDWVDGRRRSMIDYRLQRMLNALYVEGESDVIETVRQQLNEYFEGKRRDFDIPLLLVGTDFQKKVWEELMKIPYGKSVTYGEIAQHLGDPKLVRVVANATALNALNIIVPCHRVIGSDGSLTGYGGGLRRKSYLLDLEQGL